MLARFFNWIKTFFLALWEEFKSFVLTWFEWVRGLGDSVLEGLLSTLSTFIPSTSMAGITDALQGANYFFPVTEFFGLLTVYMGLWVALLAYRTIKSWIPTVSS